MTLFRRLNFSTFKLLNLPISIWLWPFLEMFCEHFSHKVKFWSEAAFINWCSNS